MNSMQKSYCKI